MTGGDDDDDMPGVDGGMHTTLDATKCTAFAASFANAATTCGAALPSGAQAMLEQYCKKGVTLAAACGGNPAGGLDCFASPDPTDWVCEIGQPFPSCNNDLASALGAYCLIASGNPQCESGIHCDFDVDCSGNFACNSETHQCFSKSGYCIGLPCGFDVDCPSDEKCNSAEHACVGN